MKVGSSIFAGSYPPLCRSTIPESQQTSTLAFAFLTVVLALQCFAGMASTVLLHTLVLKATLSLPGCLQHWPFLVQKQLDRWILKTRNSKMLEHQDDFDHGQFRLALQRDWHIL